MNRPLIKVIETRYDVQLSGEWHALSGGYESDVYRVSSNRGDMVVRISPAWREASQLRWTHTITRHCAQSVPEAVAPLTQSNGETLFVFENQPISLFPFIDGEPLDISNQDQRLQAAQLLARIHNVSHNWHSDQAPITYTPYSDQYDLPELNDPELDGMVKRIFSNPSALRGYLHGDFYRANVLVKDGKIQGIIDWDEARYGLLMDEIAWSTWEFCKRSVNDPADVMMEFEQASIFRQVYKQTSALTDALDWGMFYPLIRWRLREEVRRSLVAEAKGEDWDDDYRQAEIKAFLALRDLGIIGYSPP